MNLKSFLAKDRIRPHKTSRPEISDLLRIVERDLTDAAIPQGTAVPLYAFHSEILGG